METYKFSEDLQDELVHNIINDTVFNKRVEGLLSPEYFDNKVNACLVDISLDYYDQYKEAIGAKALVNEVKDRLDKKIIREDLKDLIKQRISGIYSINKTVAKDKLIDLVSKFAKHQAIKNALISSYERLEKGDFDNIEKLMQKAMSTGASSQFDTYSYFDQVSQRTELRRLRLLSGTSPDGVTTGILDLDKILRCRGWGKKELSLLMGGPKSGKTMGLVNFALNASLAGHNVLYVTLEVSPEIISERCDANLSNIKINDIKTTESSILTVADAVCKVKERAGILDIQEFPTGQMKPSDLRRLIEQRTAFNGKDYDMVVVDYADIMKSDSKFTEKNHALTSIYEDLRAIAQMYNVALLTATQTNREGIKAKVADMTHVAEDIGKIRTADIVISINFTEEEQKMNEARLFFAACRTGESDITLKIKRDVSKAKFITQVLAKS